MSTLSALSRALVVAALGSTPLVSVGCDDVFTLDNARPRMTWVAAVPSDDGTSAALHFWVQDAEGDSVDVTLRWEAAGAAGAAVIQRAPMSPLTGVVTRDAILDPNGQEHRIIWDLADVPSGEVTLVVTTDDDPTDKVGPDTWRSAPFDPRAAAAPASRWDLVP